MKNSLIMSKLVLTLPALYKDNSLRKETIRQKLSEEKSQKLKKKLEKTLKHRRFLSQLIDREEEKHAKLEKVQKEITDRSALLEKMNLAAFVIQHKTKELKEKKLKEDQNTENLENSISNHLAGLAKMSYFAFWNLGFAADYASTLIKRAYKRYKFRQKIERIRKVYKIIAKNKKTICRMNIRRFLRIFASKARIKQAEKEKKRVRVLEKVKEIRARLALLTIKYYWKANRITYRRFMYKVMKYKKMVYRINSRLLSVDHVGSEIPSFVSTPKNEESLSTHMKEMDFEAVRLAELRLIKEREDRINYGLISYNIKKFKQKRIPPLSLITIDEGKTQGLTFIKKRISSRAGFSSKTISYSNNVVGKSNRSIGTISTRSTSNQAKVFRFL
jgi:hypothetical protein